MFCSGKETWSAFLELIADGPPIRRGQVKDLKRLKWNFIFRPSGLLLLRFRHVLVSWGIFRRGNRLNDGQITRNQTDVKCVNTSFYFRLHIFREMRVKIFTQPLKLTQIFGAAMLNETIKQTCHDIDTEFGLARSALAGREALGSPNTLAFRLNFERLRNQWISAAAAHANIWIFDIRERQSITWRIYVKRYWPRCHNEILGRRTEISN